MSEPTDTTTPDTGDIEAPPMPAESETDRLVANISGVDDQVGMAALWRVTMDLENGGSSQLAMRAKNHPPRPKLTTN
ncbi:hypothetical protein [Ornithinimicrobium sp. INDO-MA30-4]|uniref:hypothetical protein n=1 Tax=Ornithinimicrobium sp. INDO-MA30-4 TaxID=2908651 RepID=UPI001F1C1D99|nr:hypothetical protein [Ornithinimicrobium sp. INDO-MA30-4]UJH71374.1 hypothetical protein L0A91_06450 [Ornithinimicrobium sp. INDO-MA30-4]